MKTFCVNGDMTVVIDKINFIRVCSKDEVEWFVEIDFGMVSYTITFPDEESAKKCYEQISKLLGDENE